MTPVTHQTEGYFRKNYPGYVLVQKADDSLADLICPMGLDPVQTGNYWVRFYTVGCSDSYPNGLLIWCFVMQFS